MHLTLLPRDFGRLNPKRMLATLHGWGVTLFSFIASGYIMTYRSRLPWQIAMEELPEGRDLCGEILEEADRLGVVAVPAMDLGELRQEVAECHPDWAMLDAEGHFRMKAKGQVVSSPCGPFRRQCARDLILEMRERYGPLFKAVKWAGASYGFGSGIDYNPHAMRAFREDTGADLPTSEEDPQYRAWRVRVVAENAARLTRIAHQEGGVPAMGNSVWNLGSGEHFTALSRAQDLSQVEVQTRTFLIQDDDGEGGWERFSNPIETTRYVSGLTARPPLVVASYFLAWPWRRVAVPWPEQKVYLAQVAANGGSPMVNLTMGAPEHHPDPRGFRAISELYSFMAKWAGLYEGDCSAARVALLYDHQSAQVASRSKPGRAAFLQEFHALQDAFDSSHLPYDIVDADDLGTLAAPRWSALVVPNTVALAEGVTERVRSWNREGLGLVLTGSSVAGSLGQAYGLGAQGAGRPFTTHQEPGPCQSYLAVTHPGSALLEGIPVPLVAAAGRYWEVDPRGGWEVVMGRVPPVRLFPEGIAYAADERPREALVLTGEGESGGGGRVVVFSFEAGRCAMRSGHPDNNRLLSNAVRWVARGDTGLRCEGYPDVRMSLRAVGRDRVLHLINTTSRQRYRTEFTPIREIEISLPGIHRPHAVRWLSGEAAHDLAWHQAPEGIRLTLPELVDYAMIHLRLEEPCPEERGSLR